MRRRAGLVIAAAVAVGACGSSDATPSLGAPEAATGEPAAVTTVATDEPAVESAAEPATADDDGVGEATGDQSAAAPPEPADDATAADTDDDEATADEPADDAGEVAAPSMMWPDDGCSLDNSPTPAAAADGPLPTLEVRAESVGNPLPDLAVRRINCAGGWVNLKNELPADRPLLVWFWAPH